MLSSSNNFNLSTVTSIFDDNINNSKDSSTEQSSTINSLRIGYIPNINHAQAVIGLNNGMFTEIIDTDKNLADISIEQSVFTSDPSILNALLQEDIDIAYMGPISAIDGFIASGGQDLRIISGAASGGASFIVRNDSGINSVSDLGGKTFASPQLGNTQDIALRKYLMDNGYNTVDNGGNVTVVVSKPSEILTLFLKKEIDGAWVPEPLAAKLLKTANGKILVDERDLWPPQGKFVTTNMIVRTDYLRDNPEVIKKLLEAHVDETIQLNQTLKGHGNHSGKLSLFLNDIIGDFNNGIKNITGKTFPEDEIRDSLNRINFTFDPLSLSLYKISEDLAKFGYLNEGRIGISNLSDIYDLTILNQVLTERGISPLE